MGRVGVEQHAGEPSTNRLPPTSKPTRESVDSGEPYPTPYSLDLAFSKQLFFLTFHKRDQASCEWGKEGTLRAKPETHQQNQQRRKKLKPES